MRFTWDPAKNVANVGMRSTFRDAARISTHERSSEPDDRFEFGEARIYAIGLVTSRAMTGPTRSPVLARPRPTATRGDRHRDLQGLALCRNNDRIVRYPLPAEGLAPDAIGAEQTVVSGLPPTRGMTPMHPFAIDAAGATSTSTSALPPIRARARTACRTCRATIRLHRTGDREPAPGATTPTG